MGLFSRRSRSVGPASAPALDDVVEVGVRIQSGSEESVNVVGESHYQPAIRAACGAGVNEDVLFECFAELVPEPENPYDPNAIKVLIDGRKVGHLARSDAVELGPAIVAARQATGGGLCRAVIAGHKDSETTNLGVFLHLDIQRS
jgi:hypothetical protein